ncbi:MAG: ABC transporter permease [Defluviitaleaceae bacterium]|nr:ABC transporter permease [Defluviitaleaceae bacterium]
MKNNFKSFISNHRKEYLFQNKRYNFLLRFFQIFVLVFTILIWEIFSVFGIIDSFLVSSPSRILAVFLNFQNNNLFMHIGVTVFETLIGFLLGVVIGIGIAFLLWCFDFLSKVLEPYLVILNALPKIALGPIIIIWVGAGMQAVIIMALSISVIVTIMEMLNGFKNTDTELIKMAKTFGSGKIKTFAKIVFPYNLPTLFNCLKINMGLSLVGVIAGEFLVSRAGLGFLIIYGGQVFQMDLVMSSVIILGILASLLYKIISFVQNIVMRQMFN